MPIRKRGYRSLPRDSSVLNIGRFCQKLKCLSQRSSLTSVKGASASGALDRSSGTTTLPEHETPHGMSNLLRRTTHEPSHFRTQRTTTELLETTMDMTGIETTLEDTQDLFAEALIGSVLVFDNNNNDTVEHELGDPLVYTYSADSGGTEQEVEVIMRTAFHDAPTSESPHHELESVFRNEISTPPPSTAPRDEGEDYLTFGDEGEDYLTFGDEMAPDLSPLRIYRLGPEQAFYSEANAWRAKADLKKLRHHRSDASTAATHTTASNSSTSLIRSMEGSSSSSRDVHSSLSSAAYGRLMSISGHSLVYVRPQLEGFYVRET